MKAVFGLLLILSGIAYGQSMVKIPLKVTDAYQTNNPTQDVTYLLDGDHNTRFFSTSVPIIKPHNVIFDLSDYAPCIIQRFVLYDGYGSNFNCQFIIVDTAGNEDTVYTFTGAHFLYSDTIDIPQSKQKPASKFILRNENGKNEYPDDLELWGTFTSHPEPVFARHNVPLRNLMGLVAHPWDIDYKMYPAKYQALLDLNVGSIRLYSNANSNKDSIGNYAFNPQYRGGFHPEETFEKLKQDKPEILRQMCYQNQAINVSMAWKAAGISSQLNFPYQYNNNADRLKPSSYLNMGQDLFIITERGGANKNLPDYPIWITKNWWEQKNEIVKGEGFYDVVEGGNEWDGWWAGYNSYLSGAQLAAAWSMMYDGHKGSFTDAGVKQADRNMLFTNGGIALDRPDLFREAVEWWKTNRGYLPNGQIDIPLDYYSFHCYPSAGSQYSGSQGGLPPELGMAIRAKQMVYFSNKYGGGKPVFIGEWGYDVNPGSPQNAPAYGKYNAEQTRAMWAIRAISSFSEADLSGAQWFRAYQDYYPSDSRGGNYISDNNPLQFATMALLRETDDNASIIKRTMAGDYFKQYSDLYGDYVFDAVLRNDSIWALKFKKDTSSMYIVWGVENVVTVPNQRPVITERSGIYHLPVPMNAIVRIRNFSDDGSGIMQNSLDVAAGEDLPVAYSAKPQVIEVIGQGSVLPIQLTSFTASRESNMVLVRWSVQNETAISYSVERCADSKNYRAIGEIKASGMTGYELLDKSPSNGKNYYRLKIKNTDGSFTYSPIRIVIVNTGKPAKYFAFTILGQKLYEGENFYDVDTHAKNRLQQWQPYIIKGDDGSTVKGIKQY